MPTLYNHTLYPQSAYEIHSPDKYEDFLLNGGNYGARVLASTGPDDVVQLDPSLRTPYSYLYEHLGEAGIHIAESVVWDTRPEVAGDFPDHDLSVYLFDPVIHAVRPDDERLKATRRFGDKNEFIKYCQENGFAVPKTTVINSRTVTDLSSIQLPAYVKAAESSNGKGIYRVEDNTELVEAVMNIGGNYQIQDEVPGTPVSVQYRARGGTLEHLATTDQIIRGFMHLGNQFPTRHDPRETTDALAEQLVAEGLKDTFGFDVMVNGGDPTIIECNPRWTGATYPTVAAGRLAIQEWVACVLPTDIEHPRDIVLGDIQYNPSTQLGVVVMNNCRLNSHGKIEVLIAGPKEAQAEYVVRLGESFGSSITPEAQEIAASIS